MERIKKTVAWILCLIMALALVPAAKAEQTEEPAETFEEEELTEELIPAAQRSEEEDGALEISMDGEIAPEGLTVPETEERESDVLFKTEKNDGAATFELNDGIVATLEDGRMTVTGAGEIRGYSKPADCPWYSRRAEITEVVFGSGITVVGECLFWECENLKSIQVPSSVTKLYNAFYGCTALKSVKLPSSVTHLGATFVDCTALETISAPGLMSLGEHTFQGTAIKSYTLPSTLTDMSPLAFWGGKIESFSVEAGNTVYTARNGILFTENGKTLFSYPAGRRIENVRIPDGVEKVGECAFASNPYLKTIDFNKASTLSYSAFTSCKALETLVIPDTVTEMGACVFENCSSLKSVTFGNGLEKTGYRTFASCEALESIDFGTALHTIEGLCFAYCDSLKEITLPETITTAENGSFGECEGLESFTTTALTVIPYQILLNDINLTSLTLNDGITEINRYAVYGTRSLEHVDVPASVQHIHDNAFDPRYTTITVGNPELDPYGRSGWRRQEYITVTGLYNYNKAFEVARLVNEARAAEGLNPLKIDTELTDFAMQRAMELAVMYSHTRPDGSAYYSAYTGGLWGENAAEYQTTAAKVMDDWMKSEGHRENILTSYYDKIGVGCVEVEGRCYWIQWFARYDANELVKPANKTVSRRIGYAIDTFEDAPNTSDVVFYFTMAPEYSYVFQTDKNNYGMGVGDTQKIQLYLRGCCVSEKGKVLNAPIPYRADELNWSIGSPSVATINNGVVTAVSNGKTTVTIKTGNGYFKHTVTVSVGELASAEISFADGEVQYRGTTPYVVANGAEQKPKVVVKNADGVVNASLYTVSYRNNVNAGTAEAVVKMKDTGETKVAWFKIFLPATKSTSVSNMPVPVIWWDPVPGANGYVIYRRAWSSTTNGWTTFERWNNTTSTYYYDRKVYAGTRYQYGVKAYYDDPMDTYNLGVVGPLKTIVYVTQRTLQSVTPGKNQMTVKWEPSKNFTGYQIKYATDENFTKNVQSVKVGSAKTASKVITGLKSGTTYYVTVRSYQVFEGMTYFGAWSNTLSCKAK